MSRITRSIPVAAPVEAVWRVWSDPDRWSTWNPEIVAMSLDGSLSPGTTGEMSTRQRRHRITFVWVQPERSFAFEITPLPLVTLLLISEITPAPEGCTISQSIEVTGPLAKLLGPALARQIAASFPAQLEALKSRAEGVAV